MNILEHVPPFKLSPQPNSPTTSPNVELRDSKDGIWEEEPLQQVWQWTPLRLVLAFEVVAKWLSI
jgi:hypothetical protein